MGLRERKKEHTRAAIQAEGLRLFREQGYDQTSCQQVAAAAGVSPATLFRYFPTKEDIVLHDVYDPMIAAAVLARPAGEGHVTATRRALAEILTGMEGAEMEPVRQRTALILSVPALRARTHEQQSALISHLAAAFAARADADVDDVDIAVAAAAAASALGLAVHRWARDGNDLAVHVDQALDALTSLDRRGTR